MATTNGSTAGTTNGATAEADTPLKSNMARPSWQTTIPTIHKLHHSQAQRVIWALQDLQNHNGLLFHVKTYERQVPKNEALLKISPMGKSPILTVVDLQGNPVPNVQLVDGVVMETRLILEFIGDHFNGNEIWKPATEAEQRRDVYFREFACNSLLGRVDQPLVLEVIPDMLPWPLSSVLKLIFSPVTKALRGFQIEHYNHMESSLTEETPFFAGAKLGIADMCMEFPVSIARGRGMLDTAKYPKIAAWHDRILGMDAWKMAMEKGDGKENYDLMYFGMKTKKYKLK